MSLLTRCFKCDGFIILPSQTDMIEFKGTTHSGDKNIYFTKKKPVCRRCQREMILGVKEE